MVEENDDVVEQSRLNSSEKKEDSGKKQLEDSFEREIMSTTVDNFKNSQPTKAFKREKNEEIAEVRKTVTIDPPESKEIDSALSDNHGRTRHGCCYCGRNRHFTFDG